MGRLMKFMKDWMLVIAMVSGASAYLVYHAIPAIHPAGGLLLEICTHLQPVLLFMMLFLTFCKVEPRQLKPHRWQWWVLLIQAVSFALGALVLVMFPDIPVRIGLESFILCMICPTATACAVVTDRLGGDMAGVLTYTILINLVTAVEVPLLVPLIHPVEGLTFFTAFSRILAKVFPLLIMPSLSAWLVRYLFPRFHRRIVNYTHFAFYIWAFSLTLAILMCTRAFVHHEGNGWVMLEIGLAALLSCALQFWIGKMVGARYDRIAGKSAERYNRRITAGQAMGQKNTVFAIWMGYTFMDPVTSLVGGFYSICHNVFNTWQLRRVNR